MRSSVRYASNASMVVRPFSFQAMLNGDAGTRFRAAEVLSLAPAAGGSLESDGRWREASWASRGWRKDDPKVVPGGGHVGSANDRPDYRPELQTLVTEGFSHPSVTPSRETRLLKDRCDSRRTMRPPISVRT